MNLRTPALAIYLMAGDDLPDGAAAAVEAGRSHKNKLSVCTSVKAMVWITFLQHRLRSVVRNVLE